MVIFAVPGAFTPTCSAKHLPGFIEKADSIKAKGVDSILCLSVNDVFVMDAWGKAQGAGSNVTMVADGSGDFARAAELGVVLSMQPAFEWFWGGENKMYASRLGARRHLTNRLRTPLRQGLTLAGGSDSPITPLDPRLGIAAALNHPSAGERLSFPEAMALFTTGAATAVFAEEEYGTLAPGKWASFTVLARDPRELAPEEIASAEVVATVRRGETTYKRERESG